MKNPDLVAMAIMTAVLVLPGAGVALYLRAKAGWTPPPARVQLLRLHHRRH